MPASTTSPRWCSAAAHAATATTVTVNFGSSSFVQSFASNAALTPYSIGFTPSSAGLYTLSLANAGGDNVGAILTSVNIVTTPIPEPSALALTLAGLALLGAVSRQRKAR